MFNSLCFINCETSQVSLFCLTLTFLCVILILQFFQVISFLNSYYCANTFMFYLIVSK